MAAKTSTSGATALRYATALVEIADQSKAIESVEKDLQEFINMLANSPELQQMVSSPLMKRDQQQQAISALAKKAKFHTVTANFLALLAQNRRLSIIGQITGAVKKDLARRRGEVNARVETAFALSDAQTKALSQQLKQAMGKNVTLDVEVNHDLIGGMVVTVGSKMIDDSVKRKLERLKRAMQSNSNQNLERKEEVI